MLISPETIRNPTAAGRFYPDDPSDLKHQIQTFIDEVEEEPIEGDVLALIAPHAGYVFSGSTAATAFKHLAGTQVDTVFVLSPSHFDSFRGVSVYSGAGYRTPLGVVPIDQACVHSLIDYAPDVFQASELGHREEHGVEVELPFLQALLNPGWSLVPIVMAERSAAICWQLDPDTFIQGLETGTYQACGGGPIAVAMHIARQNGPCHTKLSAHTTFADITGRRSGYMVGYGAVIMYKNKSCYAQPGIGMTI